MTGSFETSAADMDSLTFETLRGIAGGVPDGVVTDDGRFTGLGLLLSDQCPFGIAVSLPDGTVERVSGCALRHARDAAELVNRCNPRIEVEGSRTPVDRFPRNAVSEALRNAVVHRDYRVPGDVEVRVSDSGITVVSPGQAPARGQRNGGLKALVDEHFPRAIRYRGIVSIRRSYARAGYEPSLESSGGAFTVVLPAVESVRGHHDYKSDRIVAYLGSRSGGATLREISDHIGYTQAYTRRTLSRMMEDGVIARFEGSSPGRYYLCRRRRSSLPQTGQNPSSGDTLE